MFDVVIKNGTIISGDSTKGYEGDIGIKHGRILKIAENIDEGEKFIDAKGLMVSPGFIDMHTHSDIAFIQDETCDSKLYQGVTLELSGCCGFSYYPSNDEGFERLKEYVEDSEYSYYASKSLENFIDKTKNKRMAINWATYIGHGALRSSIVGFNDEKPTDSQLLEMKEILDRELTYGAFGLSLGIAYAPGMFSDIHELIELSKVVTKHNKIVTAHIRNENDQVFEAIEELIEIGRQSKAHVHVSHLKLGFGNWYKTKELFKLIDDARKEGINITIEQYPYNASSTGLSAVLPNWVHDGGTKEMLKRFKNQREEVLKGIRESNSYKMGLDRVLVVSTLGFMKKAAGKSVREISKMLNMTEEETVIYLLENTNCNVPTIRFTMEYEDVYEIMSRKDCAVISDGSAYSLDPKKVTWNPHPRNYGTFPRFIKINREKAFMSLEEAIYKMTGLPAKLLNITDRGVIKEGNYGDITIFDYEAIEDTAVFNNSLSKPKGIEYVIVNGEVVVEKGEVTNKRPGKIVLDKGLK